MKTFIQLHEDILTKVKFFSKQLKLKLCKGTGRPLAISGEETKDLEKEFYRENARILFTKPRANMKKMITGFQYHLYNTRMLIELNFRNLKMFYAFLTSVPRSIDGYLANYIYSLLAYILA